MGMAHARALAATGKRVAIVDLDGAVAEKTVELLEWARHQRE